MKNRSFLVGGALLLSALFLTSCKEMMSSLDNPVSSYLTVGEADVTIPTGDTYQINAETPKVWLPLWLMVRLPSPFL